MQHTIWDTPVINVLVAGMSRVALRLVGWKLESPAPQLPKYVMIAAPHTSNWDFPLTMAICWAYRIKIYWMGKASLFRGPFGSVMRWFGGIPVERSRSNNLVQQMVAAFDHRGRMVLAIAPEGTRARGGEWKSGFYHIAAGAGVPIVPAYLDYGRKRAGFKPPMIPSGNLEADLAQLQRLYLGIKGKRT